MNPWERFSKRAFSDIYAYTHKYFKGRAPPYSPLRHPHIILAPNDAFYTENGIGQVLTRVIYFEPLEDGHCAYWAQGFLDQVAKQAKISSCIFVASEALICRLKIDHLDPKISIRYIDADRAQKMRFGSIFSKGRAQWQMAKELLASTGGDKCFIPFFDHALTAAVFDVSGPRRHISGIIFRPPNSYGLAAGPRVFANTLVRWSAYLSTRLLNSPTLFTLDETVAEGKINKVLKSLRYLPDPGPQLDLHKIGLQSHAIGERQRYLIFGALSRRKGVFQLLEAACELTPSRQSQISLRLVGKVANDEVNELNSAIDKARRRAPNLQIDLENNFVSDNQLADEVAVADVILAPYQNHIGSSGVLYWAAAAKKPVISQNTGLMGYLVNRYQLGVTVNALDRSALADALSRKISISAEGSEEFTDGHSIEGFAKEIARQICG